MAGRKAGGGGGAELAFDEWIWLSKTPGRSIQTREAGRYGQPRELLRLGQDREMSEWTDDGLGVDDSR